MPLPAILAGAISGVSAIEKKTGIFSKAVGGIARGIGKLFGKKKRGQAAPTIRPRKTGKPVVSAEQARANARRLGLISPRKLPRIGLKPDKYTAPTVPEIARRSRSLPNITRGANLTSDKFFLNKIQKGISYAEGVIGGVRKLTNQTRNAAALFAGQGQGGIPEGQTPRSRTVFPSFQPGMPMANILPAGPGPRPKSRQMAAGIDTNTLLIIGAAVLLLFRK